MTSVRVRVKSSVMPAKGKAGGLSLVKYAVASVDGVEYVMGTVR